MNKTVFYTLFIGLNVSILGGSLYYFSRNIENVLAQPSSISQSSTQTINGQVQNKFTETNPIDHLKSNYIVVQDKVFRVSLNEWNKVELYDELQLAYGKIPINKHYIVHSLKKIKENAGCHCG